MRFAQKLEVIVYAGCNKFYIQILQDDIVSYLLEGAKCQEIDNGINDGNKAGHSHAGGNSYDSLFHYSGIYCPIREFFFEVVDNSKSHIAYQQKDFGIIMRIGDQAVNDFLPIYITHNGNPVSVPLQLEDGT